MAFAKKVHISIKAVGNVIKQLESSRTLRGYFIHTFILTLLTPGAFCQKYVFWTFWLFRG